ncbi:MAG TPA: hypothetical protein ENI23_06005 [bacterium]|nr:hypothetical protein [bacterium]
MPSIKKIIYDHWLLLVALILGSSEFTPFKLFSNYVLPFFVGEWHIAIIIILFLVLIIVLAKLVKSKSPYIGFISLGLSEPRFKFEETEKFVDLVGVKWKTWLGYDRISAGKEGQRIWVEGPYCRQCYYELDPHKSGKKWHCLKCNEYIQIPRDLREHTIEKMIKLFTSGVERQKRNNLS